MDSFSRALSGVVFSLCLLVVLLVTIRACVRDARRRGKSPLTVTLAVIFFFPWGPIAWLLFRPDPLTRSGAPSR
jgi:hypothetical protein